MTLSLSIEREFPIGFTIDDLEGLAIATILRNNLNGVATERIENEAGLSSLKLKYKGYTIEILLGNAKVGYCKFVNRGVVHKGCYIRTIPTDSKNSNISNETLSTVSILVDGITVGLNPR